MEKNRRHHKRYKVPEGVFVILNPSGGSFKLGAMLDISTNGLSFQFIDTLESILDFSELDVLVSGRGMQMKSLPFSIVSSLVFEKSIPFYSIITRRLGVQFLQMPEPKTSQLLSFINNHAILEDYPDNLA